MANRNVQARQASQMQAPAYEKTVAFSQNRALIWQLQFSLNSVTSKKTCASVTQEIQLLSETYGKDFDKYMIRELVEQIDLKDSQKATKDKNEVFKVQILNQELVRISQKPEFLLYISENANHFYHDKVTDFLLELHKRLKLPQSIQLLISLALYEYFKDENQMDSIKLFKNKLTDLMNGGKMDGIPEYALHRIIFHLQTSGSSATQNETLEDIAPQVLSYLTNNFVLKPNSHLSLREMIPSSEEQSSLTLIKDGTGLENLDKVCKMLEPWEILIDLGHFSSYNYNYLIQALSDFKEINEKIMARTLLHLSVKNTGFDDQTSRLVYTMYEANKKGACPQAKDQSDKKTSMSWSVDNLSRLFRELYSNLKWEKVFEALADIEDESLCLDSKGFSTFLMIFNKSKPQNLMFPLNALFDLHWQSPSLQLNFIENTIQVYLEKKEKLINFQKLQRRQDYIEEIQGIKEKVAPEFLHVWLSVDLTERLVELSNTFCFTKVRHIFESPLKMIPEYLLLSLSLIKPQQGNLMLDELLSLLLPQFLGNHPNSIPVLQQLWKNNPQLMIRGIYELYKHDPRTMNLSRVLDITQEVKESLIPIVDCDDYYFAVNLGILAGKRDFLHYDVWLQSRIGQIGTPFIKALLKYIKEHIVIPINDYIRRHSSSSSQSDVLNSDALEHFKNAQLEKSHFNKEKLCITLEHLQNPANNNNQKIKGETIEKIKQVVLMTTELFPTQMMPTQNSEEIDNAANDYFQKVFSADAMQVDSKITELIEIMQRFKGSEVKKEQEIYACMLHSLFDEYRFLHKYPQQYLEKIAKLFGQIIKNKIIEGTLLEIALKFAFEAFRRDGRRQKFGIIVIRQFFDMLPQFPDFFKDIYEIRAQLSQTEPQLIVELERLWERAEKEGKEKAAQALAQADEDKKLPQDPNKSSNLKADEESKHAKKRSETSQSSATQQQQNQKLILEQQHNNDFQAAFQPRSDKEIVAPSYPVKGGVIGDSSINNSANSVGSVIDRSSTPNSTPPVFKPQGATGLSINSAAFKRSDKPPTTTQNQPNTTSQQQQPQIQQPIGQTLQQQQQQIISTIPTTISAGGGQQQPLTQLNLNVNIFRPSTIKSPVSNPVNQQILQYQQQIEGRIQRAMQENQKLRMEDLIEDHLLKPPNDDMAENLKYITNTIGRNNFSVKLQELKDFIGSNNVQNLCIFIYYILSKRVVSSQTQSGTLYQIYIDIIKQIGIKGAVEIAVTQTVDCFKRLMVIDEEAFQKVINKPPNGQFNPIKSAVINLGAFLGGLTVGSNRPLHAKELDLKQLLIEGFQTERLKYVVIFSCRILKEAVICKSAIFKIANPWISSVLGLLKEIKEHQMSSFGLTQSTQEVSNEIEAVFKAFGSNSNSNDVITTGFIKALQNQAFLSLSLQTELNHILNKNCLLPTAGMSQQSILSKANATSTQLTNQQQTNMTNNLLIQPSTLLLQSSLTSQLTSTTLQSSSAAPDPLPHQSQPGEIFSRVTVSNEVLQSINKTVVQTEQQVRKMVAEAVDSSIVEILPPVVDRSVTIALITTRELVLKDFAYDGDPDKILKAADLIVKNLAGSLALVTCREPLKMSLTTNLRKYLCQLNNLTQEGPGEMHQQVNEIAQQSSKENLELGCKLIKKAVIEKAQKKVREEQQIARAIEMRKRAQELGTPYFRDESIAAQFSELPPQLQPNPNGLTEPQFQVYEDFSRLSGLIKKQQKQQFVYEPTDIESMIKVIEKDGLFSELKQAFMAKIIQLNSEPVQERGDESAKLWTAARRWLHTICEKFDNTQLDSVISLVEALSIVVAKFEPEETGKKLTLEFLELNENVINNIDLNILLLKNKAISISEWDNQMAMYLKTGEGGLSDQVLLFYANFVKASVQEQKVLTFEQLPHLMHVMEVVSQDPHIGNFFVPLLDDFRKSSNVNQQSMLKARFVEWVQMTQMSFEESNSQQQDTNRFFNDITQQDFFKDADKMAEFCKVMVEISIEKALYMENGQRRPADRLDYRYIVCFIKLIVVLMRTQNFNKHKFMIKVFDAIHETLDEDTRVSNKEFNQRPYSRMLMNILQALSISGCFNPQTQQLILISMADLFNKLNPNKYPSFAFAWIELISHKFFMPHFLKVNPHYQQQQQIQQQPSSSGRLGEGASSSSSSSNSDNIFYDKYFRFKDLIVHLCLFLKANMPSQTDKAPASIVEFYESVLRVCLVILHDFPEFFCDFHFNFVNSLPDHCIQLRNIILSSFPQAVQPPNPFTKNLKVDLLQDVKSVPKILSNFDNYLQLMNLREDLESYARTKNPSLIQTICDKMMQSEEILNGKRKINSSVINSVVLFIANQSSSSGRDFEITHKESMEMFKQMAVRLNSETRQCLFNSIVNELRYPNNNTYYFSCIVLYLFIDDKTKEMFQEQITRILFERLKVNRPYPWGLMITFRELIQNPKYGFMKKSFIVQNQEAIDKLFETKLAAFKPFIAKQ